MSRREHSENMFSTDSIIPSANFLEFLAVVTVAWEFTIAEKFRISASFLRVD